MSLFGYVNAFSVHPNGSIALHASSIPAGDIKASLVRIDYGDPNPAFGGLSVQPLPDLYSASAYVDASPTFQGSLVEIELPASAVARLSKPFTISARIRPSLPDLDDQTVLAINLPDLASSFRLSIGRRGAFASMLDNIVSVDTPLLADGWYVVFAQYDPNSGRVRVGQAPLVSGSIGENTLVCKESLFSPSVMPAPGLGVLNIAGDTSSAPRRLFNGRIEDPFVVEGFHDDPETLDLDEEECRNALIVGLDFSRTIGKIEVADIGPFKLQGQSQNLPLAGVRGSRWSGREMCWRHAPREYAALHFHEDDLYDCSWPRQFEFHVPEGLESGIYGFHLKGDAGEDLIPFFVRAKSSAAEYRRDRIAFLVPTFTYLAYANNLERDFDKRILHRIEEWGAYPADTSLHPEFGRSTYNVYRDGSGIALTSMLRPILNMRAGYIAAYDEGGSGIRHFPADTVLFDWLKSEFEEVDIVTDHDLDSEGLAAIEGYRAVVTGTHPEYHTDATWSAIETYLKGGARLFYAGANGFYWKVARSLQTPNVIEVRRAEGGVRNWAAEPGEYHHALDGCYGGLLERTGRPSRDIVGTTFSAQGPYVGTVYHRAKETTSSVMDDEVALLTPGLNQDTYGSDAAWGGGAAGFELDRVTLPNGAWKAVVIATTEAVQAPFDVPYEEVLAPGVTASGERLSEIPRGELALISNANGGLILSSGSLLFCGSLARGLRDGPLAKIVSRFLRHQR